jgi:serine/threonine protein kinase
MRISIDLSTIPLSATTVSSAGTVRWMSPELLFNQNSPPTCESDCHALGMVIYEVSRCAHRSGPSLTRHQVLTGLRPFHHLGHYAAVIAVREGERPGKPLNAESLGFSDTLWRLITACWSKSSSARPTAQQLLHYFQGASCTWVAPLEYPIHDNLDRGEGFDSTSNDGRSKVAGALANSLFVLMLGMLWVYHSHLVEQVVLLS